MSGPLGLSIGTTNLVAARVGNPPVTRRSVLTLFGNAAPEVGAPAAHTSGTVLTGFVERVGDEVPLVAADGSAHRADGLLVDALTAMTLASGGQPAADIAIAVPAHWGPATLRGLRTALGASPTLATALLVSDAVAALTTLHANPGLPPQGVVALLDFGGGGTSITLADAAAAFEPIDETIRYADFSGDQIDQALLSHVLDNIGSTGALDPAGTVSVAALNRLREQCRDAKERLSAESVTEVAAELPGYRTAMRVSRAELEDLIAGPLSGVLAAFDNALGRSGFDGSAVSAVVTVGGGASIPLITQRLGEHSTAPVVTTTQPALDAAVGAALFAAQSSGVDARTGVVPPVAADAPASATLTALAWSQDDDSADEPAPYFDEEFYPTDVSAMPPDDHPRAWHRLPQLVLGVAAAVALIAVGGVAVALTSATDSTRATDPPGTATSVEPPSAELPPPPSPREETVTVTNEPPPATAATPAPATAQVTTAPPTTTQTTTTTTTETTTTTTPPTTTTTPTATTTPITTTYLNVPFVPVPIPIQVPQNP